jgi:hypothetical protein
MKTAQVTDDADPLEFLGLCGARRPVRSLCQASTGSAYYAKQKHLFNKNQTPARGPQKSRAKHALLNRAPHRFALASLARSSFR